jgi:hypothetical protein
LKIADLRLKIADLRLKIADLRLKCADFQTEDCIADLKSEFNLQSELFNLQFK